LNATGMGFDVDRLGRNGWREPASRILSERPTARDETHAFQAYKVNDDCHFRR
jgi:hypothetical protein